MKVVVLAATLVLAALAPASAQAPVQATEVSGSVHDQSGAVLPGATVTLSNASTGLVVSSATDQEGRFTLNVAPGAYEVRTELSGFTTSVSKLAVGNEPIRGFQIGLGLAIYADTVVVTGTRTPESLRAAPVAVTVVRDAEIEKTASSHFADLLRPTPGVNAIELSARDVQVSTRTATGRNARTTLALLDGRTIYQDYFGMVLWDLLPIGFDEVKQVEVLRGPGSAIWGANALTGVVNVITKSPKEMLGTRARMGFGSKGTVDAGVVHAGARGRFSYKLSGSHYSQDAWDRPGTLPDGTVLPPYESEGTSQFRTDGRIEIDQPGGGRWRFDGGFATSSGIILVAVGPFDATTLRQGYGSAEYSRGLLSLSGAFTAHKSRYVNLLGPDTPDIGSQFTQLDAKDSRTIGTRHILVYGATFKHSNFDISFVPDVHRREEAGAFITDDVMLHPRARLTAGVRVDWFNTFGAFASPRVGIRFEPVNGHTFRAAYNRAYVAPSLVENFSNFPNSFVIPLPTGPFAVPTLVLGNDDLSPQTIDGFEVGYTAILGHASVSASLYRTSSNGLIQLPVTEFYTPANPPPGWPLPNEVLAAQPLPKTFVFSGVGNIDESGLELAIDAPIARGVTFAGSYSFQSEPDVESVTAAPVPVNLPPRHRGGARLSLDRGRWSGTVGATFTDRAFWTDVLAFQGWTDSYWLLDASAVVRFAQGRLAWVIKGTNLADRHVQHHIFGDVIRRKIATEIRVALKH